MWKASMLERRILAQHSLCLVSFPLAKRFSFSFGLQFGVCICLKWDVLALTAELMPVLKTGGSWSVIIES